MKATLTGDASFNIECDNLVLTVTRYDTGVQVDYLDTLTGLTFQSTLTPTNHDEVIQ